jgi:uncharacterized membrane protein YdjX (TVP38/TMEM64 family)
MLPLARDVLAYFGLMTVVFLAGFMPPTWPTLLFVQSAPPWLLALAASMAAAVAAVFDHHFVRRAFRIAAFERARKHRFFEMFERWAKVAPFFTTVVFAAVPLPFFLVRVLMPLSGYPIQRYAAAVALGRYPRIFVIASIGEAVRKEFEIPDEILLGLFALASVVGGTSALIRFLQTRRARRAPPEPTAPPGEGDER